MINISSVNVSEVQRTDSRCCAWTHLPPIAHKDAHAKNHIKTIAWTYWIMTFCFEFHFCWSLYFSCKSFSRPVCLYVYVKVLSSDLDLLSSRAFSLVYILFPDFLFLPPSCVHVCLFVWSFVLRFCPVFMFDSEHSWHDDYICAVRSVYSYPFRPEKPLFLTFLKWRMGKSRTLSMYITLTLSPSNDDGRVYFCELAEKTREPGKQQALWLTQDTRSNKLTWVNRHSGDG